MNTSRKNLVSAVGALCTMWLLAACEGPMPLHMSEVAIALTPADVTVTMSLHDLVYGDKSDELSRFVSMAGMVSPERALPRLQAKGGYRWIKKFARYELAPQGAGLDLTLGLVADRSTFDACAARLCALGGGTKLTGDDKKCDGIPLKLCDGKYLALEEKRAEPGMTWPQSAARIVLSGDVPKARTPQQISARDAYAQFVGPGAKDALATADWIEQYAQAFVEGDVARCKKLDQQEQRLSDEWANLREAQRKRLRLGAVHALLEAFDPEHLQEPPGAYTDSFATAPAYEDVLPSRVPPATLMALRAAYEIGWRAPDPALSERLRAACDLSVSRRHDEVRSFCALLAPPPPNR